MMATRVYKSDTISLVDNTEIYVTPLKIKYLRQFMDAFEDVKTANDDLEAMTFLAKCATVAMQQYYPTIRTLEDLEDCMDMPTVYKVLDVAAGIKVNKPAEEESVKKQATDSGSSWDTLDLAKLESEVFLLGIWKDYEELELSLSMPELMSTLEIKRELDYNEKKFLAAMQGVDLDKESGSKSNAWEDMKARVFSGGKAKDANDVTALQGVNAQKAGFGIGMGLGYQDLTKKV